MPNRMHVIIRSICHENIETTSCGPGMNVQLKLNNINEVGIIQYQNYLILVYFFCKEILPGFLLCDTKHESCHVGREFDAEVQKINN